jgi:DNA gyrase subunit A
MGVVFARFAEDDKIIAVAKNSERAVQTDDAVQTEQMESQDTDESDLTDEESEPGKDESEDE